MPVITLQDKEILDPLSDIISQKLQGMDVRIDKFKLKEFAFSRAKKKLLQFNPQWLIPGRMTEATIDKLVHFEVCLDYTHDLDALVEEFIRVYKCINSNSQSLTKDERIQELQKKYEGVFDSDIKDEREDQAIDQPVAVGGLTKLHLAAQAGDFTEVRRLVEVEKAKVSVRDNSNFTPAYRAELMGHSQIAEYLANFA